MEIVGSDCSLLGKYKICRHGGLIQEEQVGKDQNMKSLEDHEKDGRVYSVGSGEHGLLELLGWGWG